MHIRIKNRQIRICGGEKILKCPYCNNDLEKGLLLSKFVPKWKGEDKQFTLLVKKKFAINESEAYYCPKCNKLIIDKAR